MEGPTPVSALIHAATMVTAGVYLMCRVNPLLAASPDAALTVAIVGAATAFVAATIACAQNDIKKVLAYSTVSQLGYMFLAIGTGAYEAAIFLMVAHAFFKALLFLGAGSVIHGLHDEQDLKRMGNLRRYMPADLLDLHRGLAGHRRHPARCPASGPRATSSTTPWPGTRFCGGWASPPPLLTAYYMSRLSGLAFFGKDRWNKPPIDPGDPGVHAEGPITQPHESPWAMRIPLIVLAILAFFGGVLSFPWTTHYELLKWVDPVFGANMYNAHESARVQWELAITDSVIAVIGVVIALVLWTRRADRPELEPTFLRRWWFIDALTTSSSAGPAPGWPSSRPRWSRTGHRRRRQRGRHPGPPDRGLVRKAQSGYVRNYALAIVLGVVGVLAFMLSRLWWS